MFPFFGRKRITTKTKRQRPLPVRRRVTLSVEPLEQRNLLSPTVIATISFGSSRAGDLTANPVSNRVYAAQEDVPAIAVINGATNAVTSTVPTRGFHTGIDVNPATNTVYVSQQFAGRVRIIDGATNTVVADLPVPGLIHTIGDLAVNPATNRLYVIRANNNDVAVFDTITNTFLTAIPFGPPSGPGCPIPCDSIGLAVDSGTNRVYLANNLTDRVTVIDGATNSILTRVMVGDDPHQITINPVTHRVYVSNTRDNTVSVIDGTPGSPTENTLVFPSIPVGSAPVGISVNPLTGRTYVTNSQSDDVSVIDEMTGTVVATVSVGDGPHYAAVLPETSRVYVANGHSVTVIEDPDCVPIPSGLIAWWSGEGDAADRTSRHNGTLVNGVTFAPGRVGQAFSLDGIDDYIRVPHDPALNPRDGLTIEAWINSASTVGPRVIASKWNDNTSDWSYIFKDWNSTDTLSIELSRSIHSDLAGLVGATTIPLGSWVHVAATFDGNTVRLYFNGVEDARLSVAPNQLIDTSVTDFLIGAGFTGGGARENFAGLIDELAVYNRALSGAEIGSIYRAGSAGKCLNHAPTDMTLSNQSVPENQPVGTSVGTLGTTDSDVGDTHTYALVSGAGSDDNASFTITGSTLQTADAFDFETKSSYSIRVRSTDAGGLWVEKVFTIAVTDVNDPPSADAGGPYTVAEGASVPLNGSGSDPDGDPLTYTWDLDNNGTFETAGRNPLFSAAGRDGPDRQIVVLRVCDPSGKYATSTATITITNANPNVTTFDATSGVDTAGRGVRLHSISFSITATDPSPADTFTYQFDWNGDGAWDEQTAPGQGGVATLRHVYETAGTFTPVVRVLDDDGGASTPRPLSAPVSIHAAAVIDGDLVVGGTAASDSLLVTPAGPNQFRVLDSTGLIPNPAGGTSFALASTGRIILYGGAGNDSLIAKVGVPVEARGGSGNDFLIGGNSHDVLWGDEGMDLIFGGNSNDVLIGGLGEDFLSGDNGDDLLFGGALRSGPAHNGVQPYDYASLRAISAAWAAGTADADLDGGLSDDLDDTERDVLFGGPGRDWFLGNLVGSNADVLLDYMVLFDKKSSLP